MRKAVVLEEEPLLTLRQCSHKLKIDVCVEIIEELIVLASVDDGLEVEIEEEMVDHMVAEGVYEDD